MAKRRNKSELATPAVTRYDSLVGGIANLLEQSRHATARAINSVLTATYWEIGRRIVEHEQAGMVRSGYADAGSIGHEDKRGAIPPELAPILERLSLDGVA
jgi:hypothetical protein